MCRHDTKRFHRTLKDLLKEAQQIRELLTTVVKLLAKPVRPGPFGKITLISERYEGMKKLHTYHIEHPVCPPNHTQRLRVFSGDQEISAADFADSVTASDSEVVALIDGQPAPNVTLKMTHIDSQGAESPESSDQTFDPSVHNLPPSAPGAFGTITLESEREVTDDEPVRPPVAH